MKNALKKFGLLCRTLRYIKFKQIFYQVYYRLIKAKPYNGKILQSHQLNFTVGIPANKSLITTDEFEFLNRSKKLQIIDWNFNEYGKLWTYNLNYFDFLLQDNISEEQGLKLINNFIENDSTLKDGKEPYPISLRVINWIKFLVKHHIKNQEIDAYLYKDLRTLFNRVEYHLLGNHLMENGFALLFGAYYFKDKQVYKKAKNILTKELNEQTLSDGAHFELSPMYHCILLEKVLDCHQLISKNDWQNGELKSLLTSKAEPMLGWLEQITLSDGTYPLLNDSAKGISKAPKQLFSYANALGLTKKIEPLSDSGYRKWSFNDFEIVLDVGQIGPDYIPGHAHADTFNFTLHYKGKPIINDPGISTYEKNKQRQLERSTSFHNTIEINETNSSEVWGGFRVGRRANVVALKETDSKIEAQHSGYAHINNFHKRNFIHDTTSFTIEDSVNGSAKAFFHIAPNIIPEKINDDTIKLNEVTLIFSGDIDNIELNEYKCPKGYNLYHDSQKIVVTFNNHLKTIIS